MCVIIIMPIGQRGMNMKTNNNIINELQNMDGAELLDTSVAVLVKLRKIYHGDNETQSHINFILDKLYNIKF